MITKQSFLRKKLRSLMLRFFYHLENNNNTNFATNGERVFVENLFKYFKENVDSEIMIFDIGANIGGYTQMLLDNSAEIKGKVRIHLFEPTQSCMEVLDKKFSSSGQIILNKKAVSNRDGTSDIFYDQKQSGLASLHRRNLSAYSLEMSQSEVVDTIRLDGYIKKSRIDHIHFLKIDVEGHELAVLEGLGSYLNRDFIDFIQFEYGGANLDSRTSLMDFYALFEKSRFKAAKIMPKGIDIRPYSPWMDNFQYANYVAISAKIIDRLK